MTEKEAVAVLLKIISLSSYQPSKGDGGGEVDDIPGMGVFPFPGDVDFQKFIPIGLRVSLCVGPENKEGLPKYAKGPDAFISGKI